MNPFMLCKKILLIAAVMYFLIVSAVHAETIRPLKVKSSDKCPVCGMFVAKYPDFLAYMIFKDGSYAAFDGVKDMIKCYLEISRYLPARKKSDITAMYVTDYYSMNVIHASKAFYVMGSDIYGPMGRELIPHESGNRAREFMQDHKGRKILRLQEITYQTIRELDK